MSSFKNWLQHAADTGATAPQLEAAAWVHSELTTAKALVADVMGNAPADLVAATFKRLCDAADFGIAIKQDDDQAHTGRVLH